MELQKHCQSLQFQLHKTGTKFVVKKGQRAGDRRRRETVRPAVVSHCCFSPERRFLSPSAGTLEKLQYTHCHRVHPGTHPAPRSTFPWSHTMRWWVVTNFVSYILDDWFYWWWSLMSNMYVVLMWNNTENRQRTNRGSSSQFEATETRFHENLPTTCRAVGFQNSDTNITMWIGFVCDYSDSVNI